MSNTVNREIRITASDTGVADRLSKLKEGALALGRGIAEDAKKQATSSRELIKLMNDEISLIEKRNKLNKEQRELEAREKPGNTGVMGKPQLRKDLEKIQLESKEDKIQTDLLKQILEATLRTSKEEITADRESVKRRISSDKEIDTMEDHEQALKETFQRQMIKDTEPKEEKDKGPGFVGGAIGAVGRFTKPGDLYSMGLGASSGYMHKRAEGTENRLAKNALLAGGLVLGAAGMGISAAQDYYSGVSAVGRITGSVHPTKYDELDKGLDITRAQGLQKAAGVMSASGGEVMSPSEIHRMIAAETAYGINSETLARTRKFGQDATPTGALGSARMLMTDKDTLLHRARTEELLQLQLELTEKQFMAKGEGSVYTNMAIIAQIMSGQGVKSVAGARRTIGELEGMIQGGGDNLEALKYSEFQKAGGGGYAAFKREKEKGVAGNIDDLLVRRILDNPDMSDDDKAIAMSYMGLSMKSADEIIRAGGVDPRNEGKYRREAEGYGSMAAAEATEGGVGVNPIAKTAAIVTNSLSAMGEAAVETTRKLLELGNAGEKASKSEIAKFGSSNVSADGTPSTMGPKY